MATIKNKITDMIGKFLELLVVYPRESIEFVLALVIFLIAALTMIPNEWQSATSVYGNDWAKLAVGLLLMIPSAPMLYWRIRHGIKGYIYKFQKKRRSRLFIISLIYTYFIVLNTQIEGYWPPHWTVFLGLALISWIEYMRLSR